MSKSTFSTIGLAGSLKSICTNPPTEQAIWSIRPQGFPKNTFSAYWPIIAISIGETFISLYKPERIVPIIASNAAEEERPAPFKTSLVTYALKGPVL